MNFRFNAEQSSFVCLFLSSFWPNSVFYIKRKNILLCVVGELMIFQKWKKIHKVVKTNLIYPRKFESINLTSLLDANLNLGGPKLIFLRLILKYFLSINCQLDTVRKVNKINNFFSFPIKPCKRNFLGQA